MSVWDHNYLWVVDAKDAGGVDKIVSVARETGYGICAKYHDGDPSDDTKWGFQENFQALACACCRESIPVVAWGYCYGNRYGNLAKEYRAAIDSFRAGAQAYIVDAEVEWEVPGSDAWADEFMSNAKSALPEAQIGVTTFWNLRWHSALPAKVFARAGAVALPQIYYVSAQRKTRKSREDMHRIAEEDFRGAGFSSVYPVGEIVAESYAIRNLLGRSLHSASGREDQAPLTGQTDLADFLDIVGDTPHSIWLLDRHQDSPAIRLLKQRRLRANPQS